MSSCNFTIPFNQPAGIILEKAKNAITSQGGDFSGDLEKGSFHVSLLGNTVAGSYQISGNNLEINISSKPVFVPCATIESFLSKQLNK
jgi:hypothetical protein